MGFIPAIRTNKTAQHLAEVRHITDEIIAMAGTA